MQNKIHNLNARLIAIKKLNIDTICLIIVSINIFLTDAELWLPVQCTGIGPNVSLLVSTRFLQVMLTAGIPLKEAALIGTLRMMMKKKRITVRFIFNNYCNIINLGNLR